MTEQCVIHGIDMKLVYDGAKIQRWKCPKCGSTMKVCKPISFVVGD